MLQVKEICKEYRTGGYVQKALDHISLSLRDSEFVAILGPSGSGKTTLLNLIGGLDRYDSGDLIINGTSTKEYRDRDWDAYRNHSVGFIFQSYNLIPHQTILANVELALTIAGISKKERTRRAKEALERVGLKDHIQKLPNQLSGGQMQRVAIARALINEPTVLLADEPTGALDSETSIQVMELLKEVAKDRLVVMVTHNPELAETYANRIVELRDGKITSDSHPYSPRRALIKDKRRLGKASMSFFTALGLSFMNLRTKLKRTLLVSFAGSIGIIGIALILSLSTGTNTYIEKIQRDTLSEYPIQLQRRTVDLSSFIKERASEDPAEGNQIAEAQVLKNLLSTAETNDLGAFREYLENHKEEVEKLARAVEYQYDVSPLIFSEQNGRVYQVHPNKLLSNIGINSTLLSYSGMANVFHAMPEESELYEDQYDVKAGRWPKDYHEVVLVLTSEGRVTDMILYAMGMKDSLLFEEMLERFSSGEKVEIGKPNTNYVCEDFIGITFKLINQADLFTYDETYGVWTNRSSDDEFLKNLVAAGEELTIVGVVRPKADASVAMLNLGINYLPSLATHVTQKASESAPVCAQLADPSINILTGHPFDEEVGSSLSKLASMFTIDTDAIKDAFRFDESALEIDFSSLENTELDLSKIIDPTELTTLLPGLSTQNILALLNSVKINLSSEDLSAFANELLTAYLAYATKDPASDYTLLPEAMLTYLRSEEAKELVANALKGMLEENSPTVLTRERIEELVSNVMIGFPDYLAEKGGVDLDELLEEYHAGNATLSDVAKLLVRFVPSYLRTEEAQLLLNQEIKALRAELTPRLISNDQIARLFDDLADGYIAYAKTENLPEPSKILNSFSKFLSTGEANFIINGFVYKLINKSNLEKQLTEQFSALLSDHFSSVLENLMTQISEHVAELLTSAIGSLAEQLPGAFSVDPEAFASAIKINMEENELRSIISSLLSGESSTYDNNLSKFGYADLSQPSEITIYPKSFEAKAELLGMIDAYNEEFQKAGEEDKVIHYTDLVGTMMNSVTDIVNAISYVLIAFVSVSLIVSSIMIGVITYISVLERRKEIGILRAIGASKHNVASVFNAETFIIGALSGVIGVVISLLTLIPGNILIHNLSGQPDLNATLPIPAALALILLSIVLTLIGGLIPSRSAAKSDPVSALRTE